MALAGARRRRPALGSIRDAFVEPIPTSAADTGAIEVVPPEVVPVLSLYTTAAAAPDSIVLHGTAEARVRAAVRRGGDDAELLVRFDGFELHVGPGAFVEVWTPATLQEVRVMVDGQEVARHVLNGRPPGGVGIRLRPSH